MNTTSISNKSLLRISVFVLTLLTALFWFFGQIVDVYAYALLGAIFEILWLPMLGLLTVLPVLSIVGLYKENFNFKSLYWYSLLLISAVILWMMLRN